MTICQPCGGRHRPGRQPEPTGRQLDKHCLERNAIPVGGTRRPVCPRSIRVVACLAAKCVLGTPLTDLHVMTIYSMYRYIFLHAFHVVSNVSETELTKFSSYTLPHDLYLSTVSPVALEEVPQHLRVARQILVPPHYPHEAQLGSP